MKAVNDSISVEIKIEIS